MNDPKFSSPQPSASGHPGSPEPQPGRPSVLDAAKRRRITALLSVGCSRRVAARCVGCSPSTITRTAAREPDFAEELARAETHQQVELLVGIRRAAKTDRYWRAGAWLLEKTKRAGLRSAETGPLHGRPGDRPVRRSARLASRRTGRRPA